MHPALVESLKPLEVEVSLHESVPPNPYAGYVKALQFQRAGITHVLVVQDDVTVCRNFAPAIQRIAEAKDVPVVLFLGGLPRVTAADALKAAKRGAHYVRLRMREFCPVVAMLWPVAKAQEFLDWVATHPKIPGYPNPRSDDAVVGKWTISTRQEVLVTIPSLVQHPDNVPSIIGKRAKWGADKSRVALMWIGDADPLEIDWS